MRSRRSPARWLEPALACLLLVSGCSFFVEKVGTPPGTSAGLPQGSTELVIETSMGDIKAVLFDEESPITVKNFLRYVDEKAFDGTLFHRVAKGFVIQGGGFEPGMKPRKTHDPIKNEARSNRLPNLRGTLAMARTNDPDSATNQFFISLADNSGKLDPGKLTKEGYAVFGKVTEGMDVVDKIGKVPINPGPMGSDDGSPKEDIIIKSIRRVKPNQ